MNSVLRNQYKYFLGVASTLVFSNVIYLYLYSFKLQTSEIDEIQSQFLTEPFLNFLLLMYYFFAYLVL